MDAVSDRLYRKIPVAHHHHIPGFEFFLDVASHLFQGRLRDRVMVRAAAEIVERQIATPLTSVFPSPAQSPSYFAVLMGLPNAALSSSSTVRPVGLPSIPAPLNAPALRVTA
jgi:hypothetical protein